MADVDPRTLPYWKTGTSSPESWMAKAKAEVEQAGGVCDGEAFASASGTAAYILVVSFGVDAFRIAWPVIECDEEGAARRQAATMLYHDVKARCVAKRVVGARAAFLAHLVLPDGRRACEATVPQLLGLMPDVRRLAGPRKRGSDAS